MKEPLSIASQLRDELSQYKDWRNSQHTPPIQVPIFSLQTPTHAVIEESGRLGRLRSQIHERGILPEGRVPAPKIPPRNQ